MMGARLNGSCFLSRRRLAIVVRAKLPALIVLILIVPDEIQG
jgi:hypothetical protein